MHSFSHAENEEGDNECEYGEGIEDGNDEIVAWEKINSAIVIDEAYSIVLLIKDDGLMVEEEIT